jgi:hypothetical protein
MNMHTPQRLEGESQADYRKRQQLSHEHSKRMRLAGIGDQHRAPSARQQLRDSQRANGRLRSGPYGKGLRNHFEAEYAAQAAQRLACLVAPK